MTNEEIDQRLKFLAEAIPEQATKRYKMNSLERADDPSDGILVELELLNMSAMAIWAMLGEIAKRLPEKEEK